MDVFSLHESPAHPFRVGATAAPAPGDARWARRQHSHIWAPELQSYDFDAMAAGGGGLVAADSLLAKAMPPIAETAAEQGKPFLFL